MTETAFEKTQLPEVKPKKIRQLLEKAWETRTQMEQAKTEYEEALAELETYQFENDLLDGLRYGKIFFRSSETKPRETLDKIKLKVELIGSGVDPELVRAAYEAATKLGKPGSQRRLEWLG